MRVKRLLASDGTVYWVLYRDGEVARPMALLMDDEVRRLVERIAAEEEAGAQARVRKGRS